MKPPPEEENDADQEHYASYCQKVRETLGDFFAYGHDNDSQHRSTRPTARTSQHERSSHQPIPAPLRLGERSSPHLSTTQRFVARPLGRLEERALAKSQRRKGLETKQTRSAHLPLGAFAPWREIIPPPQHRSPTPGPSVRSTGKNGSRKVAKTQRNGNKTNPKRIPTSWRIGALARDHPPTSAPPNDSSPDPPVDWKKRLSQSRKDAKDWSRNKLEAHTYPLAPLRLGERSSPHLSTTQRFVARPSGRLKERTLAKSQRIGIETNPKRTPTPWRLGERFLPTPQHRPSTPGPSVRSTGRKGLSQSRKDAKEWKRNKPEAHTYLLAPWREIIPPYQHRSPTRGPGDPTIELVREGLPI